MTRHLEIATLAEYMKETIAELIPPLEIAIRFARDHWGSDLPDAKKTIYGELALLGAQVCSLNKDISLTAEQLISVLSEVFDTETRRPDWQIRNVVNTQIQEKHKELQSPGFVGMLQSVRITGGNDPKYGTKAKALVLRFVDFISTADSGATKQKEIKISQLKASLDQEVHEDINQQTRVENASDNEGVKKEEIKLSLDDLLDELNSLIGLEVVKKDVLQLVNFLKIQQLRQSKGIATVPISRHLVFYGNPGTGKTTVARLLAQIYKSLNILSKGHLIETDRSGLVAGYIGQTALKVKDVVEKALGGILFVDEAYSLSGEGQDYGREAIDTLIKLMEDNREDLIVVVAGYTDKMNKFLSSNPGLKSRFNKYLSFEDYTPDQLVEICELFCNKGDFNLTSDAREKLLAIFQTLYDARNETFGNARLARNIFEHAINNQANRLVSLGRINENDLSNILTVDIPRDIDLQTIEFIK